MVVIKAVSPTTVRSEPNANVAYTASRRPSKPKLNLECFLAKFSYSRETENPTELISSRTVLKASDPDAVIFSGYSIDPSTGEHKILMWKKFNPVSGKTEFRLPKRYMSEKRHVDHLGTAVKQLIDKTAVTVHKSPSLAGSPFISYPGSWPFVEFAYRAPITFSSVLENAEFNDPYYGKVQQIYVDAEEIVSRLMRDEFCDPHALMTALSVLPGYKAFRSLPVDLKNIVQDSQDQVIPDGFICSAKKLDCYAWQEAPPEVPTKLETKKITNPASHAHFKILDRKFELLTEEADSATESSKKHIKHVESIISKSDMEHQVVLIGYVKGKNSSGLSDIYCLVNVGNRAVTVRQLSNHAIQSEKTDRNIEPYWYWSKELPSNDEIAENFESLTGQSINSEPIFIGSYPINREYSPIKADCYLVELNLENFDTKSPVAGIHQTLVSLDELKKATVNGTVRNIPLALGADLLGAASNYRFNTVHPFKFENDENDYHKMIERGSGYRELLEDNFREHLSAMQHSSTFRRILEEVFNHGFGLKPNGDQFYSCIPDYGMLDSLPPLQRFVLLLHDWYHGIQGDLIPWDYSNGKEKMIPLGDYKKGVLTNEAQAVYFSDVFLARRYGHDLWLEKSGNVSLGQALEDCGIKSGTEQRKIVLTMIRDGKIPESILTHPNYEKVKYPIEYYRNFHDRDTILSNHAYEYWKNHPEVARSVLLFNKRCCSKLGEHNKQAKSAIGRIRSDTNRGINPLRHELYELKDLSLLKLAIEAGFIADESSDSDVTNLALETREKLIPIQRKLEKFDGLIHGVHPSENNVRVYAELTMLKGRVAQIRDDFMEQLLAKGVSRETIEKTFYRLPLWDAPFELPFEELAVFAS